MKIYPFLFSGVILLAGCASYNAQSLTSLSQDGIESHAHNSSGVSIQARAYDKMDCKRYLDRDVIKAGYQPIQISIVNDSKHSYAFSLNRISIPCVPPEQVAEKVHTSTVGRAVGYGVAGIFLWPLWIPAVVDGVKSSQANESLDRDFANKTVRNQTIAPHSHVNALIFTSINDFQDAFDITLQEEGSNKFEKISVKVQ